MVLVSTTLSDPIFRGHAIIQRWISQKRYEIHSYNEILLNEKGVSPFLRISYFEWSWVTSSDLAKYSMTRCIARFLWASWVSFWDKTGLANSNCNHKYNFCKFYFTIYTHYRVGNTCNVASAGSKADLIDNVWPIGLMISNQYVLSNLQRWMGVQLVHHCSSQQCLYLVPFLRYSTSYNNVPLKYGLRLVQSHWKWHHLRDRIRIPIRLSLYLCPTLSCIISEIKRCRKSRSFKSHSTQGCLTWL